MYFLEPLCPERLSFLHGLRSNTSIRQVGWWVPVTPDGSPAYFKPASERAFNCWRPVRWKGTPRRSDVTDMLGQTEQHALVTRLNRIEGQIRGIRRMVQEPRLCVEILQQLAAAEAALNRISLAIFRYHVDFCVTEGVAKGDVERKKQLSELVDIFDRFAK